MKVFVAWSGSLSLKIAEILDPWLESVIQRLEVFVSSEDLDKGARWSTELAQQLQESQFGILCVTPENLNSSWIHFEAGALSKSLDEGRVSPFLFAVQPSQLVGPLSIFQATQINREDVKKLVGSLNTACGEHRIPEQSIDLAFERAWPELETSLSGLSSETPSPPSVKRSQAEILEEVLDLVRAQTRMLSEAEHFGGWMRSPRDLDRMVTLWIELKRGFKEFPRHGIGDHIDEAYGRLARAFREFELEFEPTVLGFSRAEYRPPRRDR